MSAPGKEAVNAMLRAAEKGDVEAVRAAITDGVDVLARDGASNTALHLAAYRGHPEVCRALLESRADPTLGNENKDLPSHLAALACRINCLEVLFDPSFTSFKVDVEAHDSQGYCALHYACGEGHLDVARFLIEKCNADLESRNNDGLTPIMCAVQQGHKNVASVLIEANPQSIAATNNSGDTCLHYATISEGGVSMLEMLLRNGADPYVKNKDGLTPLHEAVIEKQAVVTWMGKQAESAKLLKKVMSALRTGQADQAFDIHKRKSLVTALFDAPPTEVETKVLKDEEAPPASASNKKPRSKFSSARAGDGMRAKTSIEIAKEEAATGASGVQGKAPAPKPKSRILQPGSSSAFGGF